MAVAIAFPESNSSLGPTEDGVGYILPVHQGSEVLGLSQIISCWKLTPEEVQEVAQTGKVWLRVLGGHPPVAVQGDSPFETVKESA